MADDIEISYPFRFDPWFALAARPLGVTPHTSQVVVDADGLDIRFGPWRITTPIANLFGATVTGPYAWPKVIGPPHLSFADFGITFATNSEAGVCIHLVDPVRGSTPLSYPRHGSITVTVEDSESLAAAIEAIIASPHDSLAEVTDELTLDLNGATASELRARAREIGVEDAPSMSKAELVDALRPHLTVDHRED